MAGKNSNNQKIATKLIFWMCDKIKCQVENARNIKEGHIITDDVCQFCHTRIHEPCTYPYSKKRTTHKG